MSGPNQQTDAVFMRSVLAASDDCIKVLSLDGALTFMSEGGMRTMEISDFNAVRGCPWPDFWQGQGNADARAAIATARAGGSARFQGAANTGLGNRKHWDVQVTPMLGPDGKPDAILSVSRDITRLKEAEERHHLLALELKHRMKNTIAMIQAIANQTLRATESIADVKAKFIGRLATLSAAQDLLTQTAWSKATLRSLCEGALEPYGGTARFRFHGPDTELSSKCALAMALALYELATNATKYGALSHDAGRIDVTWSIDRTVAPAVFRFRWQEIDGPPVEPPSRTGFGSRMIEKALAGYFGGQARIAYLRHGVVFTLDAPADALTAE